MTKRKQHARPGRPPLNRDTEGHVVYMPREYWSYLERVGDGNMSAGARKVVEAAMAQDGKRTKEEV